MSLSSSSSFDLLTNSSSDDEIVWSISTISDLSDTDDDHHNDHHDHDDYIVLHRRTPTTALPSPDHLASEFSRIVINPTPRAKPAVVVGGGGGPATTRKPANPNPAKSKPAKPKPAKPTPKPAKSKRAKKKKPTAASANTPAPPAPNPGLGARPIVDDISEHGDIPITGDTTSGSNGASVYEEAVKYMTAFLSNPTPSSHQTKLTLLQSLIIELGLCASPTTAVVPGTLTAAKALLRSHAFLNIRDYLAIRQQGQAALQRVMHPSRKALIRDIRKKKNPATLGWVKKHGLQVLLVTCF